MKTRNIMVVSALCAVSALGLFSCEFFEDKPDIYMVADVCSKTFEYIDYLYNQKGQEAIDGGVGTVITVTATPPGGDPKTISMTITALENDGGLKYSGDISLSGWSGDGSLPYVELSGTGSYSFDGSDYSRVLVGEFHVDRADEENTIDDIEFDIVNDSQNYVTGTIIADGVTFTYDNERLVP